MQTSPLDTPSPMTFAIDYRYDEKAPVLGLSVAIDAFMRAWFQYSSLKTLGCHSSDPNSFLHFVELAQNTPPSAQKNCRHFNPHTSLNPLKEVSCVFVPDPNLSEVVWRRTKLSGAAYASCGLVHSMSGDQVTRAVANLCLAPTHGADALICPSRSIREAVVKVWETQADYLNRRFKTSFTCPVQTPIIPIGIETESFAARATPDLRNAQRSALNIAEDEVVILFVGRLNFATKAHPLPLLLAASQAAKQAKRKIRLILYGYFLPQADMEFRFRELLRDYGDTLTCQIVTNDDPRFPQGLWAAADIFTSLVDNVQESFGLTPIEAMACGLPTVLSDWDGYRDGVRHGLDGFLIPTYAPPLETGEDIAAQYFNEGHYGRYLVGTAQSTSIDIEAAAKAFVTLADNQAKRQDMGRQAQARARSMYDWRVIIPAYEQLWQKLAEDRLRFASDPLVPVDWEAFSPAHPNPWKVFSAFATKSLTPTDSLRVTMSQAEIQRVLRHDMNFFVPDLLLPLPLIHDLIEAVRANGRLRIQDILAVSPELERPRLWRTIGWLLKHGVCVRDEN